VLVEESLLKLVDFEESEEVVLLDEVVSLPEDALLEEVVLALVAVLPAEVALKLEAVELEEVNEVEDDGEVVEALVLVLEELTAAVKVRLIMYYVTGLQIFAVLHAFIKNR